MPDLTFPEVLKQFLARMYPDVKLERLRFREGLPFYVRRSPNAITIGAAIYFEPGKFDPCSRNGIALIAHEIFHIRQGAAGFGLWFLRLFYLRYIVLKVISGGARKREHPLEAPAYELQDRVKAAFDAAASATNQSGPFTCVDGRPSETNQAFVDAFYRSFDT